MREIVLDTETTGLRFREDGDRIIEIGCVELDNHMPTGNTFHVYIDPERDVPAEAVAIHGITSEKLRGMPKFAEVAADFAAFIGNDPLIIHNAGFDVPFLNFELERCGHPLISFDRVVDTLLVARQKHPGGGNRLDDLCKRYGIDNTRRTYHGALLDSEILAEVYLELIGGRQTNLTLTATVTTAQAISRRATPRPSPLAPRLSEEERARHAAFVLELSETTIWARYEA
ncbi:DNA polymerase III subunit epsilon [Tepidamorphus sp. 3E244]|uniref:DNA polymerase III subunit epsilon n=1 Tax=Tepidamorphus sp. 3E244 TaxID=3385498 RepID=UPI0038FC5869